MWLNIPELIVIHCNLLIYLRQRSHLQWNVWLVICRTYQSLHSIVFTYLIIYWKLFIRVNGYQDCSSICLKENRKNKRLIRYCNKPPFIVFKILNSDNNIKQIRILNISTSINSYTLIIIAQNTNEVHSFVYNIQIPPQDHRYFVVQRNIPQIMLKH